MIPCLRMLTMESGPSGPVKLAGGKKALSPPAAKKADSKAAPKAKAAAKPKAPAAAKKTVRQCSRNASLAEC